MNPLNENKSNPAPAPVKKNELAVEDNTSDSSEVIDGKKKAVTDINHPRCQFCDESTIVYIFAKAKDPENMELQPRGVCGTHLGKYGNQCYEKVVAVASIKARNANKKDN